MMEYRTAKATDKQDGRTQPPRMACEAVEATCMNCGSSTHSSRVEDRWKNCRAFNETCGKSNKVGHF